MERKVNKILLIDDSEAINFINNYVLQELDCAREIIIKDNAEDAIAFLLHCVDNGIALPELIFIDIIMPRMDGWEFMDEYKKIDLNLRNQSLVFLLTSSIDPSDMAKAKAIEEIKELRDKPIDEKLVLEIFDKYINVH